MLKFHNKKNIAESLLIWDTPGVPAPNKHINVLWKTYYDGSRADIISIPKIIENNSNYIRTLYLSEEYDFGEAKFKGKLIFEYLKIRHNLSMLWMFFSIIKNPFSDSAPITDAIRIIAFNEWMKNKSTDSIVLKSDNKLLSGAINSWCINLGMTFKWDQTKKPTSDISLLKQMYYKTPNFIQALIWLCHYLVNRWPLSGVGLKKWKNTEGNITFFSYFHNIDTDSHKKKYFKSKYWSNLNDVLHKENCKTNWLHLYVKSAQFPSSKDVAKVIYAFNKSEKRQEIHVTLDTFLNLGVIIRTLRDWSKFFFIATYLRCRLRIDKKNKINFWFLFEKDWQKSICGSVAMENLLNLNLLESALKSLPKQKHGVYLQENHAWEYSLIRSWQMLGHEQLTGVPHSTVRFWDLRYFFDSRTYFKKTECSLPLPNKVALNGKMARDMYKNSGYPLSDLVEVEALRYLHILKFKQKLAKANLPKALVRKEKIQVLVLCDYLIKNTEQQITILKKAIQYIPAEITFIVKLHPACPINLDDCIKFNIKISSDPIEELFSKCDVVFASSSTTAALEAYCVGIPVIVSVNFDSLNLCPLRGHAGVVFIDTPEQLADNLIELGSRNFKNISYKNFFTLDSKLVRWRMLLNLN